jgi:hypothetical protein
LRDPNLYINRRSLLNLPYILIKAFSFYSVHIYPQRNKHPNIFMVVFHLIKKQKGIKTLYTSVDNFPDDYVDIDSLIVRLKGSVSRLLCKQVGIRDLAEDFNSGWYCFDIYRLLSSPAPYYLFLLTRYFYPHTIIEKKNK